jgi:hypothetical protein
MNPLPTMKSKVVCEPCPLGTDEFAVLQPATETQSMLPRAADDRFLSVVRSTGKTIGGWSSDAAKGIAKIGHVLTDLTQVSQQQPTFPDATPPVQGDAEAESAPPRDSRSTLPDFEALLAGRSPLGAAQTHTLRKCFDDLLLGSEEAGQQALKILAGLGQSAEPLLVACLPTDSPRVARIALEGLSRISSQRLAGCISDLLASSDPELRMVALHAAVGLPDDRQRQPLLERGLRDADAVVRLHALSYVGWFDSYWAIAEAMRLCNDKTPDVQWAAVVILMAQRPSEANAILQRVMRSLAPENQDRAAALLARREGQANAPQDN